MIDAYKDGSIAYDNGVHYSDNPYKCWSLDWVHWMSGWVFKNTKPCTISWGLSNELRNNKT